MVYFLWSSSSLTKPRVFVRFCGRSFYYYTRMAVRKREKFYSRLRTCDIHLLWLNFCRGYK